jgi:hypothetical protein
MIAMEQLAPFSNSEFLRYRAECRRMARLARRFERKEHPAVPKAREVFERLRQFGHGQAASLNWQLGRTPRYS